MPVPTCALNSAAAPEFMCCAHKVRVFTYRGAPGANVNTKAWNADLLRAGIENVKWHDLRHTFATPSPLGIARPARPRTSCNGLAAERRRPW